MSFVVSLPLDRQVRSSAPLVIELSVDRAISGVPAPLELVLNRAIHAKTQGQARPFSRRRGIAV